MAADKNREFLLEKFFKKPPMVFYITRAFGIRERFCRGQGFADELQIFVLPGDGQVPPGKAHVDGGSGGCPKPDSDADADADDGNDTIEAGELGVAFDANRSL